MSTKIYWLELDLLRGFAVILMVLNHAGFAFFPEEVQAQPAVSLLLFITSFAPILFFFITGFGIALSQYSSKSTQIQGGTIFKASALILADYYMRDIKFSTVGMDFLGFIGCSMLFFELIKPLNKTLVISSITLLLIVALRYFLGPAIKSDLLVSNPELLKYLGLNGLDHSSYWFVPWLAYPIVGYLSGTLCAALNPWIQKNKAKVIFVLFATSCVGIVFGLIFAHLDMVFFRWRTLSIAFFLSGFTAITVAMLLAFIFVKFTAPLFVNILSLRGISSLAAVPLHYFIIWLITSLIPPPTIFATSAYMVVILGITYFGANLVNTFAQKIAQSQHGRSYHHVLFGLLFVSIVLFGVVGFTPEPLKVTIFICQLAVCLILPYRFKLRA